MASPTDELYRVAASYVGPIRDAFLNATRKFLSQVSERQVESILREEGYEVAKALHSIEELIDVWGNNISEDVLPILTDAWMASGRKVSSVLPRGSLIAPFSFDSARFSALAANDGYRAAFVTNMRETQKFAISQAINRGLIEGRSRARVARDIRSVIGLTWKQEVWIENYRGQLAAMDARALNRSLRDRRSDRLIQRLLDSGNILTSAQIDSLVERYRQRMVRMRSQTIARTESLRAMRMGEYDALTAATEVGALSPLLRRFWVVIRDERIRRVHIPIPSMNSEGRGVTEYFQTPLGLMRYPLDPNGTAANVINCRCSVEYRMPNAMGEYTAVKNMRRLPPDVAAAFDDAAD